MKTFLIGMVLLIALFFCLPYHFYLRKLWKTNPDKSWRKARKLVSGFFKTELWLAGCHIHVKGEENIPADGPVLFVCNHRSYFDILITHEIVKKPVGFIAKSDMKKLPLLPQYMDDIGCVFLDRDDIKQGLATINQAAEYMKLGHSMILFPEGHRNQADEMLPFRQGGYKMAEKAKCPIVPVAISGSDLLLESAPKKLVRKNDVTIEFGEAFVPSDMPPKERKAKYAELPEIIENMRSTHKK